MKRKLTSVEIQCLIIPTLHSYLDKDALLNLNICCATLFKCTTIGAMPPNVLLNLNILSTKLNILRRYSGYIITNQDQFFLLLRNKKKLPVIRNLYIEAKRVSADHLQQIWKQIEALTINSHSLFESEVAFPDLRMDIYYPLSVLKLHLDNQGKNFLEKYVFVENCIFTLLHTLEITEHTYSFKRIVLPKTLKRAILSVSCFYVVVCSSLEVIFLETEYIEFQKIDFIKNIKDINLSPPYVWTGSAEIDWKNGAARILGFQDERAKLPFSFLQVVSLHLSYIDAKIDFKADCPNLNEFIVEECDFTSVQFGASPSKVDLNSCKHLKEIRTRQTEYKRLTVHNCPELSLSNWFVSSPFLFPQLTDLRLGCIDDKTDLKGVCPSLKKVSFHLCCFTSIELDASPSEVNLRNCKYLKDFKIKQTQIETLNISDCKRMPLSFATLSCSDLTSIDLRNIDDMIEFKVECPNLKKITVSRCSFTSIVLDASPYEVKVVACENLREFKTTQTVYEMLKISHYMRVQQSFGSDSLSIPQ